MSLLNLIPLINLIEMILFILSTFFGNPALSGYPLNALVLPGIGAATPNQESAIGQTKGEIEAIQRAHLRCSQQDSG